MLSYLAAVGAVWVIKRMMQMEIFAPQVIDNRLNPVHLAIGIRCYQIQTEVLGIPEQYGLFSSGPPRLQVFQGSTIPTLYLSIAFPVVVLVVAMLYLRNENTNMWPLVGLVACAITIYALLWYMLCVDPRRAPDYEWNDWKPHKD
ncbi:hypothetical protein CH63R_02160 [Colletotrichum higginsianum IMI 349063]|uniref:Uncharacterized protein n=1 Tax=Colletotrichum higginsianum (strain IMI 349063) TaxID=759273 RepID=A0A1B7YNB8_COLHI|nr:hypothetical protein CH63R_02160 [Colletotrichum higginsianum IMI 349063]OBR13434.1 hypothetical protein CH63R_02160 [Colletotrichum higginsianum IMI 349063]GJC95894.1 hypothetical protein ColKHC_04720 [Colletotrichum higginsianum]